MVLPVGGRVGSGRDPSTAMRPSRVSSPQQPAPCSTQAAIRVIPAGQLAEAVVEVGVDDDGRDPLLLGDLAHLPGRQPGVEQDDVGPDLRRREDRLDRPAVVAAEHGDAGVRPDPAVGEGPREPVGAVLELPGR